MRQLLRTDGIIDADATTAQRFGVGGRAGVEPLRR
jgi:hypothetical protein